MTDEHYSGLDLNERLMLRVERVHVRRVVVSGVNVNCDAVLLDNPRHPVSMSLD